MGKNLVIHLRREDIVLLNKIAKHRVMSAKMLAHDLISVGITEEAHKLDKLYGNGWPEKLNQFEDEKEVKF